MKTDLQISDACCGVCNSRVFRDYNGRRSAICEVCGSLERQRAFALALLAQGLTRDTHLAVVARDGEEPKYLNHLGRLCDLTSIREDDIGGVDRRFDILYHDHLLHGKDTFLGLSKYTELLPQLETILKPGALQLFSVGDAVQIDEILRPYSGALQDFQLAEDVVDSADHDANFAKVFDLVARYGKDVVSQGGLGKWSRASATGDTIFMRRAALI